MKIRSEGLRPREYIGCAVITVAVMVLSVCIGSVNVPIREIGSVIRDALSGNSVRQEMSQSIIFSVRLPRVLCAALVGTALALCGAAMQGLLRNPLADGSTLGVSSGASLGAVVAIAFQIRIPGFSGGGTMLLAMLFAFLSLALILSLAHKLDFSLTTNTIILVGVIFSMFSSSLISLIVTFAGERVKTIIFWTMGSLSGSNYVNAAALFIATFLCGAVLLRYAGELNAFAIGEDNARHVGIHVRRVKLIVLISVSVLVGVCVSVGGTIGFVGLVIPHIVRRLTGPNHRRLLPVSMFGGAVFLMLADLVSRVLLRPLELPIGVVTSMIGSVVFIYIFYSTRKAG